MTTGEESSATNPVPGQQGLAAGVTGPATVVVALLPALTTSLVLADLTFVTPTRNVVTTLLAINFVAALVLLTLIGREVRHFVQARRQGSAGPRLHDQILGLFSVIAVVPVALVAVVAIVNGDRGLDRQFLIRTQAVVRNSVGVSSAYMNEHKRSIQAETDAMAVDVVLARPVLEQDIDRFHQFFTTQASLHNMSAAMMLRSDESVIVKAETRLPPDVEEPPRPTAATLAGVGDTGAVAGMAGHTNYIGALTKLKGYDDAYLYVAGSVDPRVVAQMDETENNIEDYVALEAIRTSVVSAYALMYAVIALTVMWIGFALTKRVVAAINGDTGSDVAR